MSLVWLARAPEAGARSHEEAAMGFLDNARKRLGRAVDQHGDKISQGIDRAAAEADKRTGGKHGSKITKASARAKDALERLDGKDDDVPPGSAGPGTGPSTGPSGAGGPAR